ncbi:MAG: hypothetical protein IPI27_18165 [Betaproteobacteria bacterium]|nr:hypothetical protein [Betaproteobacteria bacterium]
MQPHALGEVDRRQPQLPPHRGTSDAQRRCNPSLPALDLDLALVLAQLLLVNSRSSLLVGIPRHRQHRQPGAGDLGARRVLLGIAMGLALGVELADDRAAARR